MRAANGSGGGAASVLVVLIVCVWLKVKYKQDGRKDLGSSLYHRLAETAETQLAKELRGVCSQVRSCCWAASAASGCADLFTFAPQVKYQEDGKEQLSRSLYSALAETPETQFVKQMSEIQSEVRTLNASF